MTLPQDTRAPHRQQRWLELENVGSATIPPFGAVEVVDSYRKEPSGYTPGDGRVVYRVRLSTVDSPCASLINGPCEIPAGQARKIGTMDDPMLALVADSSYPVNTQVGIKKGSFFLEKDYCGYLILSTDFDAPTGTLRVKRWDNCGSDMMVKAYECIKPGDMDKIAIPQKWNSTSKCWEDDTSKTPIKICDCNKWLLALPDECFKVERGSQCGEANADCWRPSFPYGLTRRVKIKAQISPEACGDAVIMKQKDGCVFEETDCEIKVCNPTKRRVGCDADEMATLHITPGECGGDQPDCFGWIVPDPRAMRAAAEITGELCSDQASFRNIKYLDICGWTPRDEPTSGGNPALRKACEGKKCELTWNDCDCRWDVLTVEGVPVKPVLDMKCPEDDCGPIVRVRPKQFMYVEQCEDCGEVEDDNSGIVGTMIDIVTNVTGGTGSTGVDVLTSAECVTGDTCGLRFATSALGATGLTKTSRQVCVYCATSTTETTTDIANIATLGRGGGEVTINGTNVDVLTGLEAAASSPGDGMSVLTGASCGSSCGLSFTSIGIGHGPMVLKKTTLCLLCGTSKEADDGEGPDMVSFSAGGSSVTIPGTQVDVLTGMTVKSEEIEGGGGTEEDCDTAGTGVKLVITGTTTRICAICGTGPGGSVEDGDDIPLTALKIEKLSAASDIDFTCSPCPSLAWDKKSFWAFCVGAEETGEAASGCECTDCPQSSPSATGV
jgi:hypothetical protein